jgi:hypothetical protein
MKSSLFSIASLAFVALPLLAGCGSVDAERPGAEFPEAVGYDTPSESGGSGTASATSGSGGVGSGGQTGQAGQAVDANGNALAEAYAPASGDLQIGADPNAYVDTDPSALSDFKPALDPYGTWVDDSSYGTVWVPSTTVVGSDFAPYVTAGHWTYDTDYVWVSDYDWGWAPFHYGRWVYTSGRGWSWIPGRTYAGAWVTWRYGYDNYGYVGWAPLPPTWYWRSGIAVGVAFVPPAPYVFCGYHDVFAPVVATRVVVGAQVPVVAAHTRPYVPASPTVGGPAGHTSAHPTVGGPPPSDLNLAASDVPRAPADHRGLLRAQQFAKPASAQALGARPPAQVGRVASASPSGIYRPNGVGSPRSGFSAPLGGRDAAVVTAQQYKGIAPTPHPPSYSRPAYTVPQAPAYSAPRSAPAYPSPSAPAYSAPSRPAYSAPAYAAPSRPAYSAPSYSAPSRPAYSAPSYSAPSYSAPSRPAFSAPSSPSYSAPRSAPSFHSAPSSPARSPSAPSMARPSVGGSRGPSAPARR